MLPLGHAAGGYLVGTGWAEIIKCNLKERKRIQFLGILGGLLPDFDLIIYHFLHRAFGFKSDIHHHAWLTHTFPFYLLLGSLISTGASRTKNTELAHYSTAITAGACMHLAQDMCGSGDGIQLFFPFSRQMFGIRLLGVHGKEWRRRYVRDSIFWVEGAIILVAVLTAIKEHLSPVRAVRERPILEVKA